MLWYICYNVFEILAFLHTPKVVFYMNGVHILRSFNKSHPRQFIFIPASRLRHTTLKMREIFSAEIDVYVQAPVYLCRDWYFGQISLGGNPGRRRRRITGYYDDEAAHKFPSRSSPRTPSFRRRFYRLAVSVLPRRCRLRSSDFGSVFV